MEPNVTDNVARLLRLIGVLVEKLEGQSAALEALGSYVRAHEEHIGKLCDFASATAPTLARQAEAIESLNEAAKHHKQCLERIAVWMRAQGYTPPPAPRVN